MRRRLLSRPIMTKPSLLVRGGLALVLLISGGACNRGPSGAGTVGGASPAPALVKLAFVTNNTSEFWKIAGAGIHKYEKEGKVQVDLKLPAGGTAEGQNQILQDLA